MLDLGAFGVFLSASVVLAVTPGPGIFYVLARSLRGGRREGLASSLGTAIGGFGHVLAAGCGASVILASSATAFTMVKYMGAAYLVYLGVRTILSRDAPLVGTPARREHPLVQGAITEMLNPKTALFFLAFIPQFVDPGGPVFVQFVQFVLLGSISVGLNTAADLVVAYSAGPLGDRLRDPRQVRRMRLASGGSLLGLGVYVACADERP